MSRKDKVLSRLFAALAGWLGISPVFWLACAALLPRHLWLAAVLPALPLALGLTVGLLPRRCRVTGLAAAAVLQTLGIALPLYGLNPWAAALAVPALALLLFFARAQASVPGMEWQVTHMMWGAVLHLIGQALKGRPGFEGTGGALPVLFTAYLIACLLILNRYALIDASGAKGAVPKKLLSPNRRMLWALALVALAAGNFQVFQTALMAAWAFLRRGVAAVILFLMRLWPVPEETVPLGGAQDALPDMGGLMTGAEPSLLAVILEKILIVLAALACATLVGLALYYLLKRIKTLFARLMDKLRAYGRALNEDYVDRTESLLDWDAALSRSREKWQSRLKRLKRPPPFESLPPRERVRRVYSLWLKRRGSGAPLSATAREALQSAMPPDQAAQAAALYERARYSSHPISPEEAEAMRRSAGV